MPKDKFLCKTDFRNTVFLLPAVSFILFFCSNFAISSDSLQSGIDLLNAVQTTLANQPNIQVMKQDIDIKTGQLRIEQGRFDSSLGASIGHSHEEIPRSTLDQLLGVQEITDTTRYNIQLTREFRTGVAIQPGISLRRIYTQEPNYPTENRAQIDFIVTVPLLKSGGREVTEAGERVAKKAVDISMLRLRHQTSLSILNTVKAYWLYLAAEKELHQLRQSEIRAENFVKDIRMLIQLDERPAADMEQAQAYLAEKKAARSAGTQKLFEARQLLGLAIGIPFDQITVLPQPTSDFPVPDTHDIASCTAGQSSAFMQQSLTLRQDYQAMEVQQEAGRILVNAAQNGLQPKVDMAFRIGYSGLDEGSQMFNTVSALGNNIPGITVGAGINYHWPFNNNAAYGVLMQRKAEYEQIRIMTDDLSRSIYSSVAMALSDLITSSQQLAHSQMAVHSYKKAVENENTKFKMGVSTVLDRITIENSMTHALLQEIAAQAKFSNAVVRLRHETGTLLAQTDLGLSVGIQELTTIPSVK
jgi:outer membrane protein TolC